MHEAAAGICRIVDSKMADLLRRMSVLRGLDPRAFTCFAYGGMGPVHASAVARNVGMKRLVIPVPHIAPVWSAFGATVADVVHVYQRPQRLVLPVAPATLEAVFGELEQTGRDVLRSEGFTDDRIALRRSLRMRYAAQVFDVEVPLEAGTSLHSDDIGEAFAALYEVLYGEGAGHAAGGIAITALVVRASGLIEPLALAAPPPAADPQSSTRPVYWYEHGEFTDTPVLTAARGRPRRAARRTAAHRVARHRRRRPARAGRAVRRPRDPDHRPVGELSPRACAAARSPVCPARRCRWGRARP